MEFKDKLYNTVLNVLEKGKLLPPFTFHEIKFEVDWGDKVSKIYYSTSPNKLRFKGVEVVLSNSEMEFLVESHKSAIKRAIELKQQEDELKVSKILDDINFML